MTSMRFEYITSQDAELFKRRIHNEDRLRKQFVNAIPDVNARRVWRGFEGIDGSPARTVAHSESGEAVSSSIANSAHRGGQTMQLFFSKKHASKKNKGNPLAPVTHQTLDKELYIENNERPTSLALPLDAYQAHAPRLTAERTKNSTAFPLSPTKTLQEKKPPLGPIPAPPPLPVELSHAGLPPLPASDDVQSVFSRGSSSVAMIAALKRKKKLLELSHSGSGAISSSGSNAGSAVPSSLKGSALNAVASPLTAGPSASVIGSQLSNRTAGRSVRTTSTQRERLHAMAERLSRIEDRVQESVAAEAKVHESLEQIKQLVLNASALSQPV